MDAYQEKQGSLNSSVIKQAQGLDDIQGVGGLLIINKLIYNMKLKMKQRQNYRTTPPLYLINK